MWPVLLAAVLSATLVAAQCQPHNSLSFRSPVTVASGLAATPIFANLTTPRGIAFDSRGSLLVIERGLGVTAFTEHDPSCNGWLRSIVVTNGTLTQGIQVDGNNLYVSSAGQVLRYNYNPSTRSIFGSPTIVIDRIPATGELTTRPILLYPSYKPTKILVGSPQAANIDLTARDPSSGRSQVRIFSLSPSNQTPQNFFSGTLLAYGIRNPAAFAYLGPSRLWVLDNGASIDNITSVTPEFVNDNPADELELVDLKKRIGASYGFPDCTTLWNPDADPIGAPQYTNLNTGDQISLHLDPLRDDTWCRNSSNNVPPRLSFQSHSVPLDLKFYIPSIHTTTRALPLRWAGDAIVSFHGSFNRSPPTGYSVVRVPFDGLSPKAPPSSTTGYETLVEASDLTNCPSGCTAIRPVGLAFSEDGRLFVSSDSSGELFVLSKL